MEVEDERLPYAPRVSGRGGHVAARVSRPDGDRIISGTVVDPQRWRCPGCHVTVINEATSDARVRRDRRPRRPSGHRPAAGQLHGAGRAGQLSALRAEGVVLSARSVSRSAPSARGRRPWRNRDGRGDRHACEHGGNAACRRHHADANRADPGARPRRQLAHAAVARASATTAPVDSMGGASAPTCRTSAAAGATGARSSSTAWWPTKSAATNLMAQQINLDAIAEVRSARIRIAPNTGGRAADSSRICQQERRQRGTAAISITTGVTRR